MSNPHQTQSQRLRQYGISLAYLAKVADRSAGYAKLWSCGVRSSKHLDEVMERLIAARQQELQVITGK